MQTMRTSNRYVLDEAVRQRADHRRRQEREQHADDEARRRPFGEHVGRQRPEPAEIDRQQRQDRAELDQDRERLAEVVVAPAEKMLHQQQMPGRGHRQEFGQALDDAEHAALTRSRWAEIRPARWIA